MTPSNYINMSSAPDSETRVSPGHLRSAPSQPHVLRSAPLSDSVPSSFRPPGLSFWYFSLYPFVLLTIGKVPMTHKGSLLLLFLCSMKIAQALVVKLLEI